MQFKWAGRDIANSVSLCLLFSSWSSPPYWTSNIRIQVSQITYVSGYGILSCHYIHWSYLSASPLFGQLPMEKKIRFQNPFADRSRKCKVICSLIIFDLFIVMSLITWGALASFSKGPEITVILPLYSYPNVGAWEPLYVAYILR